VLLNNVPDSISSKSRRVLEVSGSNGYVGLGSINILSTASLQDSYLSLDSYNLPRYDGVKVSSLNYNTYTSASATYGGDKSFGKTAAIDHYVKKFGLFTQIVSSSFLPLRNTTALKYLVDESGSLTELNQSPENTSDNHWIEIQNTFKLGKNAIVAQFDNQQYSDQKTTDGPKTVFDSGYSYHPMLYYSGSDQKLYFQYVGKGNSILMHLDNSGFFISGSSPVTLRYTGSNIINGTSSIYPVFDVIDENFTRGNTFYSNFRFTGSTNFVNNFPTYSVPQNANMAFSANFGISVQFPTISQSVTYKFDIVVSGSTFNNVNLASQTLAFNSSPGVLGTILVFNTTSSFRDFNPGDQIYFQLRQFALSTNNFTASLTRTGEGTVFSGLRNSLASSGINPFATSSAAQFIQTTNGVDTLILNQSLSGFTDYLYLPTTSSVSLHGRYGNTDYTFSPKVGDTLLVYYNNNIQYQELNINNISFDNSSRLNLRVTPNLVSNLALTGSYTNTTVSTLLLLSKLPDETNINLSFDKEDGTTSYGFVIPDNLSPDVLKNIDTITRQVKSKILSTNQGITINTI
jgi:hypothetical protein